MANAITLQKKCFQIFSKSNRYVQNSLLKARPKIFDKDSVVLAVLMKLEPL